ncbi:hypothetical protein EYF80_017970 [Liparis tanakae]|uniref:Uncharacterized protein n=1 Tax=Liparis tanakae TaxID=230148 RepID=A0A4Z2I126_9TELE|nr:hypothetical protein EYF80_017970 [Liparis tanakae]
MSFFHPKDNREAQRPLLGSSHHALELALQLGPLSVNTPRTQPVSVLLWQTNSLALWIPEPPAERKTSGDVERNSTQHHFRPHALYSASYSQVQLTAEGEMRSGAQKPPAYEVTTDRTWPQRRAEGELGCGGGSRVMGRGIVCKQEVTTSENGADALLRCFTDLRRETGHEI